MRWESCGAAEPTSKHAAADVDDDDNDDDDNDTVNDFYETLKQIFKLSLK